MSYIKDWTRMFIPNDMTWANAPDCLTCTPAREDTQAHVVGGVSQCFLANNGYGVTKGTWRTPPISIASLGDAQTTEVRLGGLAYNKLLEGSGLYYDLGCKFQVWIDDLFQSDVERTLSDGQNRTIPLDKILLGTNVSFGLYQHAQSAIASWISQHVWGYKVYGTYTTQNPPVTRTCTVRVFNAETATPLQGITAALYSGMTVIDSAQTNDQGIATLQGFDSSYILKVYAGGYTPYPFEATVDLATGDAALDVALLYTGEGVLPWWWWIPVAAIGGVAISYFLVKSFRAPRRAEPPVYVVR